MRRLPAVLALVLALVVAAACGGGGEGGTAELWVTRDSGAEVLLTAEVPAGVTALEAVEREAEIETRHGGRFVHAIEGVAGDAAEQRDWFYLVNGVQLDVGAAEIVLHDGDVAWWDYRSWRGEDLSRPVVAVGAFPEPFRHGVRGERRPVELRFPVELEQEARALLDVMRGSGQEGEPNLFVLEERPGETGALLTGTRGAADDSPVTFRLAGSREAVAAAARALAADPTIVRYRYEARFDEQGRVVE